MLVGKRPGQGRGARGAMGAGADPPKLGGSKMRSRGTGGGVRIPALQRQRRAYHDTGVGRAKSTAAAKEYAGTKSARAKRVARDERKDWERARARLERDKEFAEMSDTMMDYLEDEFTSVFLAILYAFSIVFFILAIVSRWYGSRKPIWGWIIGLSVPWFVATTAYLIEPRMERWTVDGITKFYFRLQELSRSDAATVTETLEKWWEWRKVQKPPRVFGV